MFPLNFNFPFRKSNGELTTLGKMLDNAGNGYIDNEIADIVNVYGAKNLLPNNATNQTVNGVTFTVNSDGTITANGTATTNVSLNIHLCDGNESFVGKKVILSGCPIGGDSNTYNISAYRATTIDGSGGTVQDFGSGIEFTFANNGSGTSSKIYIFIQSGQTVSNLTFKPMIRLVSIQDDTYEPYAKTNQELTQDTTALFDNLEVNGAVNMLPNNATTQVVNGVTFTVNDDGSVTANGTATANAELTLNTSRFEVGKCRLSGCPSGGSLDTYLLFAKGSSLDYYRDFGDGVSIINDEITYVRITIKKNVVVSNLTFKPMITVPSYNGDYVPYAKSNKELTDALASLQNAVNALNGG